jgi:hypothetical protein
VIDQTKATVDFGPRFVELARSIYKNNDDHAADKRQINERRRSRIIQVKSLRRRVNHRTAGSGVGSFRNSWERMFRPAIPAGTEPWCARHPSPLCNLRLRDHTCSPILTGPRTLLSKPGDQRDSRDPGCGSASVRSPVICRNVKRGRARHSAIEDTRHHQNVEPIRLRSAFRFFLLHRWRRS